MTKRIGLTTGAGAAPDGAALWRFSLAFYACPGVAEALLALQDCRGLDVNLILFGLWLGLSGRPPLTGTALAAADRAIDPLRAEIVEPLRRLRRRLKPSGDSDVQRLRDGVKAIELAAEEAIQHRLAAGAGPTAETDPAACLVGAYANLALCLGREAGRSAEATAIRDALKAFAGTASELRTAPRRHPL